MRKCGGLLLQAAAILEEELVYRTAGILQKHSIGVVDVRASCPRGYRKGKEIVGQVASSRSHGSAPNYAKLRPATPFFAARVGAQLGAQLRQRELSNSLKLH
ncbi:hypothetical protein NDU88_002105 [Pleurodeles waltl]|uniref:Uncharacterized protein n=1 Tax=Pleurodeles waltl TaxID=8319 RepID=A0AAV7R917_PLEWA|nr:hypothetical protein NDU88_002105 [Pleurodeles waltl]